MQPAPRNRLICPTKSLTSDRALPDCKKSFLPLHPFTTPSSPSNALPKLADNPQLCACSICQRESKVDAKGTILPLAMAVAILESVELGGVRRVGLKV